MANKMTQTIADKLAPYEPILTAALENQERLVRSLLTSVTRMTLRKIYKEVFGFTISLTSGCCGSRRTTAVQLVPLANEYFALKAKATKAPELTSVITDVKSVAEVAQPKVEAEPLVQIAEIEITDRIETTDVAEVPESSVVKRGRPRKA